MTMVTWSSSLERFNLWMVERNSSIIVFEAVFCKVVSIVVIFVKASFDPRTPIKKQSNSPPNSTKVTGKASVTWSVAFWILSPIILLISTKILGRNLIFSSGVYFSRQKSGLFFSGSWNYGVMAQLSSMVKYFLNMVRITRPTSYSLFSGGCSILNTACWIIGVCI